MINIFIISDPHFHHKNMAIRRGFANEIEMNDHIIKMWNSVVTKRDTVIIIGDITLEKANYDILNCLNGIKKVVMGNHDQPQHAKELLKYVNGVAGMIDYKNVTITHCPIHPSQLDFRFKKNIHGHVHTNSLDDDRYINVSAEVINYTPVLLKSLL